MLSQLEKLKCETDGRYATDAELKVLEDFMRSYFVRVQAYQRLQVAEALIIQQVQTKIRESQPELFMHGNTDISSKWKRDTVRVLRYSAIAMLVDDPISLKDKLLFWFQTIMKAFGAEKSCAVTYSILQDVVRQHLTPTQASLFCPILEINRQVLGACKS